ncbi:PNPLA8 [Branchiostoma lanceolatum]|uniref:PNPLA8 protein n=1 Tax=Branchiostoma lanceolatum TaxID=7740 RepID=A0A8K0A5K6_BRALA|nr:PNPLA8 [Branchiostoma lanceolatum]
MTESAMAMNTSTPSKETSHEHHINSSDITNKYQLVRLDPGEESGSFLLVNQSLLAERNGSAHTDKRAPVVSFLGSSGAGKSTMVSLLLSNTLPSSEGPNIAAENQLEPETDGLWFYPGTQLSKDPKTPASIVIDTEAMGAQVPREVAKKLRDETISPHWLHEVLTQHAAKRKLLTECVVPPLLYLISDVLVFVHQNPTNDSSLVDTLVEIGDRAVDGAEASKPALMIIQNKFRASTDDMDVTKQFLRDFDHDKRLSMYYQGIRVLRMPKDDLDSMKSHSVKFLKRHLSDMCRDVPGRLTMQAAETIGLPPIQSEKLFWMLVERLLRKVNETLHDQKHAAQTASSIRFNRFPSDITKGLLRSLEPRTNGFEAVIAKFVAQLSAPDVEADLTDGVRKLRRLYPEFARNALELLANALALDLLSDAEIVSVQDIQVGNFVKGSFKAATKLLNDWSPCSVDINGKDGKTHPCTLLCRDHGESHNNPTDLKTGQIFSCSSSSSSLRWPGRFEGQNLDLTAMPEFIAKTKEAMAPHEGVISLISSQIELLKMVFNGRVPSLGRVCFTCLSHDVHVMMSCGHAVCTRDSLYMKVGETTSCPLHESSTGRIVEVLPGVLQLPTPRNVGVRVLCLDGGGVRGLVLFMILQEIKKMAALHSTNLRIYELFDAIVGTSAGAIASCSIGLGGLTPAEAIEFHFQNSPRLIGPSAKRTILPNSIVKFLGPRFKSPNLRTLFGDHPLSNNGRNETNVQATKSAVGCEANATTQMSRRGEVIRLDGPLMTGLSLPVVGVCAYDVTDQSVTTFSSHDCDLKIADVLTASTAAPIFFPTVVLHHKGKQRRFTDGEVGAKCPAAEGKKLVEKIWPDRGIDLLLSLGCGVRPVEKETEVGDFSENLLGWLGFMANISTSAETIWRDLPKDNDCFVRINPGLESGIGYFPMDSLELPRLQSLIADWLATEQAQQQLRSVTCKLAAKMYFIQPQRQVSEWRPGQANHVRIVQRLPRFHFTGEDFRVKVSLGNHELSASALEIPDCAGELDISLICPAKSFTLSVTLCMLGHETDVAGSPLRVDPTGNTEI